MEKIDVQVPSDAHLLANPNFYRLGEFFGINDRETRLANKDALEEVLQWGEKASESKDLLDVLLKIREVERSLGTDPNESRLTRLRRFVALEKDQARIDKEMELLKGVQT